MPAWFTPAALKPWLEAAAFAATIVMGLVSILIIVQISLAKAALQQAQKDLSVRSAREAITLAAAQCEKFGSVIIPKYNKETLDLTNAGLKFFNWHLRDTNFTTESVAEGKTATDHWLSTFSSDRLKSYRVMDMLNALEAFALPFATGVADETVAYPVVASPFMDQVLVLSPYLISLREKTAPNAVSGRFENTVKLYSIWANRAGHDQLNEGMAKLLAQHKKLPPPTQIKPIGT